MLLSSLALHMAAPGQRLVPEPLTFASTLLASALPPPATAVDPAQRWLSPASSWSSSSEPTAPLSMTHVLQSSAADALFQADSFKVSLLQAALGVVSRAAEVFAGLGSIPELFAPALKTLTELQQVKHLPRVSHTQFAECACVCNRHLCCHKR